MYPIEKMARLFDAFHSGYVCQVEKPTKNSMRRINEHFGIQFPASLIEFANRSNSFGTWFAGLGEDYENPWHIIKINSLFRKMRRRKHRDKWRRAKPGELIIINHGHDRDCDCIDASDWNEEAKEYRLVYWYPGLEVIEYRYDSFLDYINEYVLNEAARCLKYKDRIGATGARSREQFELISQILGPDWVKHCPQ